MEGQTETSHESLSTRLYDAATEGDLPSLHQLLQEDPLILDRFDVEKSPGRRFTQSPLHIAVNLGRSEFAKEILRWKPELAEGLDETRQSTPLHLASGKGYLDVVKALLNVNPDMCLARDRDGRNPLHVAAIKGQTRVLDELLQARPQAAQERTNFGESVLHLCVKHSQRQALNHLISVLDDGQLLNSKDGDGKTVLHLAVEAKQPEMVKFLLMDKRMEKNAINTNGLTAMDTCIQSRKKLNDNNVIWHSLKQAKALHAKDALELQKKKAWSDNQRNALMVVASLIATMAFQVGISPPRGAWQADDDHGHVAGSSILADTDPEVYNRLLISNTVSLVSSLSVIFLLISGLPCKRLFVGVLMITMWIAVSATTFTYLFSMNLVATSIQYDYAFGLTLIVVGAWLGLIILLLLGHVIRFCKRCFTWARTRPPV